jgi:hypothetical protein
VEVQLGSRQSETAAPGGGVGDKATPTVVGRCVATSSLEVAASQRGQKPLNAEIEESTTLEAVARQLAKIQQTEKT